MSRLSGTSKASLFMNAPVGEEMTVLLRSANPPAVAKSIIKKMNGDPKAIQGLKTSFSRELLRQSRTGLDTEGIDIYSGAKFQRLIKDNEKTARAFQMTNEEIGRLRNIALRLRKAEATAGSQTVKKIVEDLPSVLLDIPARLLGAKSGQRLAGSGLGSGLVLAQAGSSRTVAALRNLTADKAEQLLVAAANDPKLYAALLTRTTAPPQQQEKAARILDLWLAGQIATSESIQQN